MFLAVLLTGCPARFDLRADPVETSAADPAIQRSYAEARARYDRGDLAGARDSFRTLRIEQASAPSAQASALWEARADLALGDPAAAVSIVDSLAKGPAEDPVAQRARFLLGVALCSLGEAARGRALLEPFLSIAVAGDEAAEMHAALASAALKLDDASSALVELERFYEGARPVEQAWVRSRVRDVASSLSDAAAERIRSAARGESLANAALALRAASRATSPIEAAAVLAGADPVLRRFGLAAEARARPSPGATTGTGVTSVAGVIGVILPLSGKNRLLGERALRGVLLASGTLPPGGSAALVVVRDSASSPDLAAAAVDDLVREGAAAVVGSPDRSEAASASARAAALGIALLDLSSDESRRSPADPIFKLLRPNAARAVALANRALKAKARRYAVLRPDTAYGKKMGEAFVAAIRAGGGEVLADLTYAEKATTFIEPAKRLAQLHLDVVFVPAAAGQLELVAAQLAATGVIRAAGGAHVAVATLYATADGLSPARFLANGGRHAQGAVLAPAFLVDAGGAAIVDRFRAAYGEDPSTVDALAYDAVFAIREAVGRAGEAPSDLRRAMPGLIAAGHETALTGALGFGPGGQRAGSAPLYVVDGELVRPLP